MRYFLFFCGAFSSFLFPVCDSAVMAWGASTHRALTRRALALLGDSARRPFAEAEARAMLNRGCVAPDERGPGWIPPFYHRYHPDSERIPGGVTGGGPRMVASLVNGSGDSRRDTFPGRMRIPPFTLFSFKEKISRLGGVRRKGGAREGEW